ncbi:MAG: preprotein translocase subunit YajC [Acidobacteria bacterium]|nr:preprotein translocase subunit YajC [Acidobacteriota bacterium]
MSGAIQLIPLLLIFAIFYVLIILPERRRRKKLQQLINNLKVGDKIVTSGGVYGTILSLRDERLTIRSDQSKLEISRTAVAGLQVEPGQEQPSS